MYMAAVGADRFATGAGRFASSPRRRRTRALNFTVRFPGAVVLVTQGRVLLLR